MKIAINFDATCDRFYDALHQENQDDQPVDIDELDAVLDCFDALAHHVDFLWYDDETEEYKSIKDSNIILNEYFSAGSDTVYLRVQQLSRYERIIDTILDRYGVEMDAAIEMDRDVR